MKRLRNHWIGIDDGDVVLFSDFEDDGEMWRGEGPRLVRREVVFAESFRAPPSVRVGLSMWDISNTATARVDVTATDILADRFWIEFRTWADSKIARVRVNWQAIGELRHADEWDLY